MSCTFHLEDGMNCFRLSCKSPTASLKYVLFFILVACILLSGCSGSDSSDDEKDLPAEVSMLSYYPFKAAGYWAYSWQNIRGDSWMGSMSVLSSHKEQSLNVVIVADSLEQYGQCTVHRSAYLWDGEGLKHLYRTSSNGDSTSFRPPRLVLPAKLVNGKTHRSDFRSEVYSPFGDKRYAIDTRIDQAIIDSGTIEVEGRQWENCLAVETVSNETHSNGTRKTKRKVIWYAKDVGPVKIITGIPLKTPNIQGEETGILTMVR